VRGAWGATWGHRVMQRCTTTDEHRIHLTPTPFPPSRSRQLAAVFVVGDRRVGGFGSVVGRCCRGTPATASARAGWWAGGSTVYTWLSPAATCASGEAKAKVSARALPMRVSVYSSAGGEQQSVTTAQSARRWARPPYRHFKIQSCCCVGSFFEVAAFKPVNAGGEDNDPAGAATRVEGATSFVQKFRRHDHLNRALYSGTQQHSHETSLRRPHRNFVGGGEAPGGTRETMLTVNLVA
jgi:hypothetical protein